MSDEPSPDESKVKLFSADVSMRGLIAFLCILTLCGATLISPELFAKVFESTATAIVFFYFGQNSKK